ncbi:MAG: hypothetical protein ACJA2D_001687 [Pseudohongiellaceae bacterium]|jgi:hypothetical protein
MKEGCEFLKDLVNLDLKFIVATSDVVDDKLKNSSCHRVLVSTRPGV